MSKHTPAPWYLGDGSEASNYEGLNCVLTLRNEKPTTLARINSWFEEESEANSRLIAAAPELLEQVKQFDRVVRMLAGTEIEYSLSLALAETLRNAQEVIAKAEGAQ